MAGEVALRFGQRMKQRRLELGLKQREVADRMGGAVTKQHISDWERGYNEPSDRYKLQLVDALEVPDVGWFFGAPANDTPDVLASLNGNDSRLVRLETMLADLYFKVTGERYAATTKEVVGQLPDRLADTDESLSKKAPAQSPSRRAGSRSKRA